MHPSLQAHFKIVTLSATQVVCNSSVLCLPTERKQGQVFTRIALVRPAEKEYESWSSVLQGIEPNSDSYL